MMQIFEDGSRKIAILKLIGDPLGEQDAKALRNKVSELHKENIRHVILDMSGVKHINSAGLGGLIAAMFTILQAKGDVRFACIGSNVLNIFRMTHLNRVFVTDRTVEEALANFRI